jgi:hypothetical protein
VKFKLIDQEKAKALETTEDVKAQANIQIINKSQSAILFKVIKTNSSNMKLYLIFLIQI